ncbi:unnamed protein product [Zymoseptoria tritici ST99CH_3D1]|nr:unnamed protein product [Zymoseptoria tritici ST99CH_3D1]
MRFQAPLPNMPTQFRTIHPRDVTKAHPMQRILPSFLEGNSPSIADAIWLYFRFVSYALPIFHTLMHREPELTPRDDASKPSIWLYPEPLLDLSKEQEDCTWTFLGRMGSQVTWVVDKDATDKTLGWTLKQCNRPLLDAGLLGYGSIITTTPGMIQMVEDAFQSDRIEDHKRHSFNLAFLWLHELSHAIRNAVVPWLKGSKDDAMFLGPDASTSEDGFEVQSRVFGGRLFGSYERKLNAEMVLQEWPDVGTIRQYRDLGYMLLTRGSAESLTREWTIRWKVEPSYWERMFEDSFWTKTLVVGRSDALWPDKSIGVLCKFVSRALTKEEEEKLERKMELEGYERRRNDLLVRKGLELELEAMYESDSDGTAETDSDGMGDVEMGDLGDVRTGESEDAEMTDAE